MFFCLSSCLINYATTTTTQTLSLTRRYEGTLTALCRDIWIGYESPRASRSPRMLMEKMMMRNVRQKWKKMKKYGMKNCKIINCLYEMRMEIKTKILTNICVVFSLCYPSYYDTFSRSSSFEESPKFPLQFCKIALPIATCSQQTHLKLNLFKSAGQCDRKVLCPQGN